jgi:hypothetical protein
VLVNLAYRIHSSETTAGLLEEIGGFHLDYRGITEIKVVMNMLRIQRQSYELFIVINFRVEAIIKHTG